MKTITAYKCKQCGQIMYPKHFRCLKCYGREFEEIPASGKAKLLTFTLATQMPWGIDERERALGIVEFDNGIRAMGVIKDGDIKLGMKLIAGWEPVRVISGETVYGLTFRPIK